MSSMVWHFKAVDSWFFRSGKPFGFGQSITREDTVFPPPMTTLQGAIRTAVARQQGWQPGHDDLWPAILGTANSLGRMTLSGPFLMVHDQIIYPMPLNLLKDDEGFIRLIPGKVVRTDLGNVQLPVTERRGSKVQAISNAWIDMVGLQQILAGEIPEPVSVKKAGELWTTEARTGLAVAAETGTAKDGMLFDTVHIRLCEDVSVVVAVDGLPVSWQTPISVVPLGGEGRFARVWVTEGGLPAPALPKIECRDGLYRVLLMLVTPGVFSDTKKALAWGPLEGLRCVSAVTGRLVMRGGWDLHQQRPRQMRGFVPAGSVWFYRLTEQQWQDIQNLHGRQVGLDPGYGYGLVALGTWKETDG